ncbi:hypothetical protein FFK22_016940 [Mycobacterium sp. KBS0706]|uniref:hypothetical protein n=1 Tax=Mycobacterium sp. KBS0706 TaxID=2578109 RepID=UPI00110F6E83|nr:hypothetical protein [Mycobacterium sp. KBS0706]TSD87530.1 hypothetical protein FFK22_016940 [Mycobacterium sp. KBS0706]
MMGRNSMPTLGEWRDGKMYRFAMPGDQPWYGDMNRELISFEVHTTTFGSRGSSVESSILATAWADGVTEMLAAFYSAGYSKGLRDGEAQARRNIRLALGLHE